MTEGKQIMDPNLAALNANELKTRVNNVLTKNIWGRSRNLICNFNKQGNQDIVKAKIDMLYFRNTKLAKAIIHRVVKGPT